MCGETSHTSARAACIVDLSQVATDDTRRIPVGVCCGPTASRAEQAGAAGDDMRSDLMGGSGRQWL